MVLQPHLFQGMDQQGPVWEAPFCLFCFFLFLLVIPLPCLHSLPLPFPSRLSSLFLANNVAGLIHAVAESIPAFGVWVVLFSIWSGWPYDVAGLVARSGVGVVGNDGSAYRISSAEYPERSPRG